jgi:DNA-binding transcriptional MerR regulator
MRLAELSGRSGVATATIKYYLREGLLPAGRRVSATRADYDEGHLRRLRLVRAMIQVGRMPVAKAREVLAALDDDSVDQHTRLGAASWALPHGPEPAWDDKGTRAARATADALLETLEWRFSGDLGAESPAYGMLVAAIDTMNRLGYPCEVGHLLPYGRLAAQLAVTDLDLVEDNDTPEGRIEAAVAMTVLYEPVLLSLRRMAQAEESNHRFTEGT